MKKSKKAKKSSVREETSRLDKLVDSLELVSARMLDMIVTTSQLASSQTPEMRALFQKWTSLMSNELLPALDDDGTSVNLAELSEKIGISRTTAASLFLYLDRRGDIEITEMRISKDDGKNREICDCVA